MIFTCPVFVPVNGNRNFYWLYESTQTFLQFSKLSIIKKDSCCFVVVELHVFINHRSWLQAHCNMKWNIANSCYFDVDRYVLESSILKNKFAWIMNKYVGLYLKVWSVQLVIPHFICALNIYFNCVKCSWQYTGYLRNYCKSEINSRLSKKSGYFL